MLKGRTLQELAVEIERQNQVKRDYLVDPCELKMTDNLYLSLPSYNVMPVNEIAHDQIGTKLGIPARYYDRMRQEQPELLATNVNTWLEQETSRRMVRTLDGTVRAFLSDKYRRIDNYEIATAILPIIGDMNGAIVESCEITERRMYLKVVNPRIQTEIKPGDVVQSGIMISNSETGLGSVTVMPLVYRLVCSNGMIAADNGHRKFHTGRANEADANYEVYTSETIKADDQAFIMKLQDTVRATSDMIQFERIVTTMRTATEAKIISPDIPVVVELAAKNYGLLEKESAGVLSHLIRGGDLSLYGLANAVTRQAQDVESYDRSTELEMVGWNMMKMPRAEWNKINAA